jgi:hypothetical protein
MTSVCISTPTGPYCIDPQLQFDPTEPPPELASSTPQTGEELHGDRYTARVESNEAAGIDKPACPPVDGVDICAVAHPMDALRGTFLSPLTTPIQNAWDRLMLDSMTPDRR